MFQVLEKAGERKAVYSKSDCDYMVNRGWSKVVIHSPLAEPSKIVEQVRQVAAVLKPPVKVKRKYTRRAK